MQLSTSKTREKFPLSRRKILKKTITGTIIWGIVLVFLVIPLSIIDPGLNFLAPCLIAIGVFLLTVLLVYLYQNWYFAVYFYDLTDDFIVIRKGPITPREITIPYERVQDVYVDQDIFDRILGLYDVHLSSATISSGMEAHIDGVEKQAADGLRAHLLEIVHQRISRGRAQDANISASQ